MTDVHPLLGKLVLYTLNEDDAMQIRAHRAKAGTATARGNDPRAGEVYSALIVRVWGRQVNPRDEPGYYDRPINERLSLDEAWINEEKAAHRHVNLQVFLDGTDVYWATSRTEFDPSVHGRRAEFDHTPKVNDEPWIPDPKAHWVYMPVEARLMWTGKAGTFTEQQAQIARAQTIALLPDDEQVASRADDPTIGFQHPHERHDGELPEG